MQKLIGKIRALSPITHSQGVDGISSSLRREPFVINGSIVLVPVISGNAIRGVLRRACARDLLSQLQIKPEDLPPLAYHLLHDGGIIQEGVHVSTDVEFLRKIRFLVPLVSLFGGCVRQTPLSGKLVVHFAIPICSETEAITDVPSRLHLADLVGEVMFTRRDDREAETVGGPVQMRYFVECFNPGTEFVHSFLLKTDNPVEVGAFHAALERFRECPYLGGRSAAGLGLIEWSYEVGDTKPYREHVKKHKKDILDVLNALV